MIKRYLLLFLGVGAFALLVRALMAVPVEGEESKLRALIIPIARVFVDTFNSSSTAIIISLSMVFAGLALLSYFWFWHLAPIIRDLRAIRTQLQRTPFPTTSTTLAGIDAVMNRYNLLSRNWHIFRNTLSKDENGSLVARMPPARYFDLPALRLNLRFFLGLPNDFVGIGLVFTFLGLVAGLYFATRSMMSPDLGIARDALVQLLHAATFKFLTSITGIGVSLVISWAQRLQLGSIEGELAEICFLLEQRLPYFGGFGVVGGEADAVASPHVVSQLTRAGI